MIAFENRLKQFVVVLLNLLACTFVPFGDHFDRTFSEQVCDKISQQNLFCAKYLIIRMLISNFKIPNLKFTSIISVILTNCDLKQKSTIFSI